MRYFQQCANSSSEHRIFSKSSSFEKLVNKLELFHSSSMYRAWANNDRMPAARRARQYRSIVVDLRLFRMRSDRDAINNDALTDPMAGGRPHESHDLTFAWVACPRPIARASRRESRSQWDFCARQPERSERAISSVTTIATTDAPISRASCVPSLSLPTRLLWSLPPSPNRLFTFNDVSTSPYFLENYCLMFRSVACTWILARHDSWPRNTEKSRTFFYNEYPR